MAKSIAYQMGAFFATKAKLKTFLLLAFLLFFYILLDAVLSGAKKNDTPFNSDFLKLKQDCAGPLLSSYQAQMQAGDFMAAKLHLATCEGLEDGSKYKALRHEADKKHLEKELAESTDNPARRHAAVALLVAGGHPVDPKLVAAKDKFVLDAGKKAAAKEAAERKQSGVLIGMTKADVLASSWGAPKKVNTTTRANSSSEQWVYGGSYLYFENGILTTIQN